MITPLTGLGWTSSNVPVASWIPITTTVEGAPANFGKGFAQKYGYYLCFTSSITTSNPAGDVLYDVMILSEKSLLPSGYSYAKEFLDPKTSISKKKRLCVKLIPMGAAETAVCDIILSSKSKVVPNYMRIGVDAPSEKPFGSKRQATIKRHETIYDASNACGISAIDGVPFTLHPKFENSVTHGTTALSVFKNFHIKSLADIEEEYDYSFVVERTAAARLPPAFHSINTSLRVLATRDLGMVRLTLLS